MDWWIRFWLGLPCRPEDVEYIRTHLPELLDPDRQFAFRIMWPIFLFDGEPESFLPALREWVASADESTPGELPNNDWERELQELEGVDASDCPAADCPLRPLAKPSGTDENDPSTPEELDSDFKLDVILAGDRKAPKALFLDLVKKHHAGGKGIKEVIITDPYLLADTGETGESGGYANVVEYFSALGLKANSSFKLLTNPRTTQDKPSKQVFDRTVKAVFPKVEFDFYPTKYRFHDRLYLVRDRKGILTGVFGPSLNGLDSESIVMMGEIDDSKTLTVLRRIFG